jgi:hypothetical protein
MRIHCNLHVLICPMRIPRDNLRLVPTVLQALFPIGSHIASKPVTDEDRNKRTQALHFFIGFQKQISLNLIIFNIETK